jgi:hypothetical protein
MFESKYGHSMALGRHLNFESNDSADDACEESVLVACVYGHRVETTRREVHLAWLTFGKRPGEERLPCANQHILAAVELIGRRRGLYIRS